MTRTLFALLTVALLSACATTGPRAVRTLDPEDLPAASPLTFEPPEVERLVTDNGIIVYLLEDHELPLLDARAWFEAGSIHDPDDKVGLSGVTGTVHRTGGTEAMTGDELDEELEFMAASIETGIGQEAATSSLSCLSRDSDRAFELWADVLRNPAFRQEKIDLAKNQIAEGLRRMNDDPMEVCRREFRFLVMGRDNPWVRVTTQEDLDNIAQEDMFALHGRFFHPNNMRLAIAGDFERDEMLALIEKNFGDWERGDLDIPEPPPVPDDVEPGIYFIHRPDLNQANVRLGHLGAQRHNPDHHELKVMNFIYGTSGFTSELMREVRSNRGLTYGIGGAVTEDTERGFYYVATFTKNETVGEIVDVILDVTSGFQAEPPSAEQVRLAQESEANSFVFRFSSSMSIAAREAALELQGYPDDYLETYLSQIQAVTAGDVQRVAREHIDLDDLVILIVGTEEALAEQLESMGDYTRVPLIDYATGEQIWP
jgi:predicted Zn-dependent peptidase